MSLLMGSSSVKYKPRLTLPADHVALGKRQEHAVDARIAVGAFDELLLMARRGDVIDHQPAAWHQAWHDDLIDLGVQFRRLDVGEAKSQRFSLIREVESIAVVDSDRTVRAGFGDVGARQGDFVLIEIHRR